MIIPDIVTKKLLFSTVRIEVTDSSGRKGTGTGFFYDHDVGNGKHIPMIITNKHVVNDAVTGNFYLHEAVENENVPRPSGQFFNVNIHDFRNAWIAHPKDDVDLCAMLFMPLKNENKKLGKSSFSISLDNSLIFSDSDLEQLSAVEEVLMIGYPIGLWDEANNLPIIRRGTTATHPAIDFNGRSMGVIDAACFPGSSGSPVLIVNEGGYTERTATSTSVITGRDRVIFLGVLFEGPYLTTEGQIEIRKIPTHNYPVSITKLMIHLGYIIKAKEVITLAEYVNNFVKLNASNEGG